MLSCFVFFLIVFNVFFYVLWEFDVVVFVDGVGIVFFWEVYVFLVQIEDVKGWVVGEGVNVVVGGIYQYC